MRRLSRALVFALILILALGTVPAFAVSCGWASSSSTGGQWGYIQEVQPDVNTVNSLGLATTCIVGHRDGATPDRVNYTSMTIPTSIKIGALNTPAIVVAVGWSGLYEPVSLNSGSFSTFPNLTTIDVPDTVTTIGRGAFGYCKKLTSVTGCRNVKVLGQGAFAGCTSLTSYRVPSSVTTMKKELFTDCTSLKTIYIPTSVTSIGEYLCMRCGTVTVRYAGTSAQWANVSKGGNNGNLSVICEGDSSGGGSGGDSGGLVDDCHCSSAYSGWYVVKNTSSLAINNGHGYGSGYTQRGTIPGGTKIYISKATGYHGLGKSSGNWGHVTYNGIEGCCAMNYLEKADSVNVLPASDCTTCSASYAGYYTVRGTSGALAINNGHGSASSGYTQLGTIPEGATVYISKATGYNGRGKSSGNWGHVTYNGVSGCCAMNYLDVTDGTDSCSTSYAGYYRVKNTAGNLAINNGHGYGGSYTQLGVIPEGTIVYISKAQGYSGLGKSSGNWGHVSYNGVSGLCAMNYLEYVGSDVTSPSISGVSASTPDVSGFEVYCTVSDDVGVSRVQCAVWTSEGGQDDLRSDWTYSSAAAASIEGSMATYRVSYSDHNDEHGEYIIDIYAYDQAGNYTSSRATVYVDKDAPALSARIINLTKDGYDVEFTATDDRAGTKEVRIETWTDKGGEGTVMCDSRFFSSSQSASGLLHVTAPDNWLNTGYHSSLYTLDALDNASAAYTLDAYVDAVVPEVTGIKISGKDSTGFTVTCTVADDHALSKVILSSWTPDNDDASRSNKGKDRIVNYEAEADGTGGTYTFRVNTSDHNDETYTNYSVNAVAVDACGNQSAASATKKTFVTPSYSQMVLPADLQTIEAGAFMGSPLEFVILPSGCKTLRTKAFANSPSLKLIYIPASVTKIPADAFSGSDNVVILAPLGSYAQTYAETNGIPWIQKDK